MSKSNASRLRSAVLDDGSLRSHRLYNDGQPPEHRVMYAAGNLSKKMVRAISELERYSESAADELSLEHQAGEAELRLALRDVLDRLAETEMERDALWDDNERLRHDIVNLRHMIDETRDLHGLSQRMAVTRGWRFLEVYRRIRRVFTGK